MTDRLNFKGSPRKCLKKYLPFKLKAKYNLTTEVSRLNVGSWFLAREMCKNPPVLCSLYPE